VPELGPFRPLIAAGPAVPYGQPLAESELTGPTQSTRIWVDDVNSDGKLDILVGDRVTLIAPASGVGKEEFKSKFAAWQGDLETASEALQTVGSDAGARRKANEEYRKVYVRRTEFMNEEMTGFVWLYLHK
jgi:hypothetical protein